MRNGVERALAAFAWGCSLFPLWTWWFVRIGEPFDAGMAAWAALMVFIVNEWRRSGWNVDRPSGRAYLMAAVGLASYWVLRPFLPITLCGLFGVVGGLPLLLPRSRDQGEMPMPLVGLAVAGLPSLLILDMFLGVPLRAISTVVATALLRITGLDVVRNGLEIAVGGVPVLVDAPCAGVKMLGTGIVLALVLAQMWRLRMWRTICVCGLAVVAVCVGNAARVAVLTAFAAAGRTLGGVAHEAVGGVSLLAALLIVVCVPHGTHSKERTADEHVLKEWGWFRYLPMVAFFAVAALCASVDGKGWRTSSYDADSAAMWQFPGWPETFDGEGLVEEPQSEQEKVFARDFSGKIGRFRAGRRTVILRWTASPTHRVHGAAYCLQATGWKIEPLPISIGDDGAWSVFRAMRGGETLMVREHVLDADGTMFTDVPTWFFNAFFGRSAGPWWIVTVAE